MKMLRASICSMLAAFACLMLASAAGAASVTVPDNSTGLAGVAAATTALLLDAGIKPRNAGAGVFTLEAKNFHCDQSLNGALDASNVRAGLPALRCRINSQNKRGTTAGQPFGDARAMTDLLQKVQGSNPAGGAAFSDCGMEYCGIFLHDRHQDRQFQQWRPLALRFHRRAVTSAAKDVVFRTRAATVNPLSTNPGHH
jgi:hypothetical protein